MAWIQPDISDCQLDFLLSENEKSVEDVLRYFCGQFLRGDTHKKIFKNFRQNTSKFLPLIHFEATENQDNKTKVNNMFHSKKKF